MRSNPFLLILTRSTFRLHTWHSHAMAVVVVVLSRKYAFADQHVKCHLLPQQLPSAPWGGLSPAPPLGRRTTVHKVPVSDSLQTMQSSASSSTGLLAGRGGVTTERLGRGGVTTERLGCPWATSSSESSWLVGSSKLSS